MKDVVAELSFEREARKDLRFLLLPFVGVAMLIAGLQSMTAQEWSRIGVFPKVLVVVFVASAVWAIAFGVSTLLNNRTRGCRVDTKRAELVFWMHKKQGQQGGEHRVPLAQIKAFVVMSDSDSTELKLELADGTYHPQFHMLNVPHDHIGWVHRVQAVFPQIELRI